MIIIIIIIIHALKAVGLTCFTCWINFYLLRVSSWICNLIFLSTAKPFFHRLFGLPVTLLPASSLFRTIFAYLHPVYLYGLPITCYTSYFSNYIIDLNFTTYFIVLVLFYRVQSVVLKMDSFAVPIFPLSFSFSLSCLYQYPTMPQVLKTVIQKVFKMRACSCYFVRVLVNNFIYTYECFNFCFTVPFTILTYYIFLLLLTLY